MDTKLLLPEKYPFYIEKFTKHSYPACFDDYCTAAEAAFVCMETQNGGTAAAAALMDYANAVIAKRWWRKKLERFDICHFFFLYTLPAAKARGTAEAECFSLELQRLWNEQYPGDRLNIVSYQQLFSGFKNKIFGFDIGSD